MLTMILCLIGTTELVVIGGAILLFFGGKKIPELMKSMGQGVKSFKDGMREGLPEDNSTQSDEKVMQKEDNPENYKNENQ